jgi:hypothetical protein
VFGTCDYTTGKELVGAEEDRARPGVALPPTLAKQGRSFDHNGDPFILFGYPRQDPKDRSHQPFKNHMKMGLDSPSDQPNAKRVKADPASGYYSSAKYCLTVAHFNCHSGFLQRYGVSRQPLWLRSGYWWQFLSI